MNKYILVVIVALFNLSTFFSSHFVGGDVHFEQIGANEFTITVRIFRDWCNATPGAISDVSINGAGIYQEGTNNNVLIFDMNRISLDTIDLGDACFTPTGVCVEIAVYEATVTLADFADGYYFTYHSTARNDAIVNMENQGMTWEAHIPNPALNGQNSSPKFKPYASDAYFCVGSTKILDFSCTDADGDVLVYSLVQPLDYNNDFFTSLGNTSALPDIPLLPFQTGGYSMTSILGPGGLLTINSSTGLVTARPGAAGVFLFRIKCEEYRGGIKIGEIFGDFQYEAPNCAGDEPPELGEFSLNYDIDFEGNSCIDITASDFNINDTFYLNVTSNAEQFGAVFSLPDSNDNGSYTFYFTNTNTNLLDSVTINEEQTSPNTFIGLGAIGSRFCWSPNECNILSIDTFKINILAYSVGCDLAVDSLNQEITLGLKTKTTDPFVPNVFSPNADNMNDFFTFPDFHQDRCYDVLNIEIFNRWGKKVYETNDPLFKWDGKDLQGDECAVGTYYAIVQGLFGQKNVTDQFSVTLFR